MLNGVSLLHCVSILLYNFCSIRFSLCKEFDLRSRCARKVRIESFDLNEIEMTRQVPVKFSNINFIGSRIVFCVQPDGWMEGTILLDATQTYGAPKNWSLK